jgi:hypothetical protein
MGNISRKLWRLSLCCTIMLGACARAPVAQSANISPQQPEESPSLDQIPPEVAHLEVLARSKEAGLDRRIEASTRPVVEKTVRLFPSRFSSIGQAARQASFETASHLEVALATVERFEDVTAPPQELSRNTANLAAIAEEIRETPARRNPAFANISTRSLVERRSFTCNRLSTGTIRQMSHQQTYTPARHSDPLGRGRCSDAHG